MATVAILEDRGALLKIDVPLTADELPTRLVYARPRFRDWLQNELPAEPADRGGRQSPLEQVDDLLHRFLTGQRLLDEWDLRALKPVDLCVWELKTIDVRIFGWFPGHDVFIAVNGAMAWSVKQRQMYAAYRDEVCIFRGRLDLDEPKYLHGSTAHDVLSV
jgi:hypothetical protein